MERLLTGEIEIRGGRKLAGIAMPWDQRSDAHREKFEPNSIELAGAGVSFNIGHDREKVISWTGAGLTIESRDDGLHIESELASANPVATRARQMVERGIRGLSVEFKSIRETRDTWGDRIIQSAILSGVALLGNPSYPTAAELRRKPFARSRIKPAGVRCCNCVGPDADRVDFAEGAFEHSINLILKGERDLIAHVGGFSPDKVLATAAAGTLTVALGEAGELLAEIDERAASTPAGRMLAESNDATAPVLRPLIDDAQSEFVDTDGVRVYSQAFITSLLLKVAQDPTGWEGIEIPGEDPRPGPEGRRDDGRGVYLWL